MSLCKTAAASLCMLAATCSKCALNYVLECITHGVRDLFLLLVVGVEVVEVVSLVVLLGEVWCGSAGRSCCRAWLLIHSLEAIKYSRHQDEPLVAQCHLHSDARGDLDLVRRSMMVMLQDVS